MSSQFERSAFVLFTGFLFVSVPAAEARHESPNGGEPGGYAAGHASFVFQNSAGRSIAVEVWYPADQGELGAAAGATYTMDPYFSMLPATSSSDWEARGYDRAYQEPQPARGRFPLVMFSSGLTMPAWAYLFAGTRLASHGFVVAAIQHPNEGVWPWDGWEGIGMITYNRPRDLSAALDEMLRRDRTRGDLLYRTIDRDRIVASGHSYGGYAAFASVGGDDQVCDAKFLLDFGEEIPPEACQPTPRDERFAALVTFDGTSPVMRFEELARIDVPSLVMGQAFFADGPADLPPDYYSFVARPHAAISRDTRSLRLDFRESDHFTFSNMCDGARILFEKGAISADDMANFYEPVFCQAALPFAEGHRIIAKYVVAFLGGQARLLTERHARENEPSIELYWNEHCRAAAKPDRSEFTYFTDMEREACAVSERNPGLFF